MKLLCIGDSIVAGYPFEKSKSFPAIVEMFTGWEVINRGMPGATSGEIGVKFEKILKDCNPDAVLILCGTNDALYMMSGARIILANIVEMQRTAEADGVKAVLVIPALCYPHQAVKDWGALREPEIDSGMNYGINPIEQQYISANNILTELHELMLEYCSEASASCIDLQSMYKEFSRFHDGIHPTVEGYNFIGKKITEELYKML